MPKAVPFDREAVKAVYLTCLSFKETAQAFPGLKAATIRQWASRDSTWPTATNGKKLVEKGKAIIRVQAEKAHKDIVAPVTSASEAIANLREQHKETFLAGMSQGLAKAAQAVETMDGLSALDQARNLKSLGDTGRIIFNLGAENDAPRVQINLLNADIRSLRRADSARDSLQVVDAKVIE